MDTTERGYNQLTIMDQAVSVFLVLGLVAIQLWPMPALSVAPWSQPLLFPYQHAITFQGEASYYSRKGCLGCNQYLKMANGRPLNDNALTMAIGHNSQQYLGRYAKITNPKNNKMVVVYITDTGNFDTTMYGNRVADVTLAVKKALDLPSTGSVTVQVFPEL